MEEGVELLLDPVNGDSLEQALANGCKTFAGANCTVSLMLMGLAGLFKEGLVESAIVSSYQAASGAGAANMKELLDQFGDLHQKVQNELQGQRVNMLDVAAKVQERLQTVCCDKFGAPLAANLIPWIDSQCEGGITREEWKGVAETNKLLGLAPNTIKVDSTCVRVGCLRSHSQSITLKLKQDLPLEVIEEKIKNANPWVSYVANNKEATLKGLTPAAVSGTLNIAVGRLRKLSLGGEYINIFTVGDQLL